MALFQIIMEGIRGSDPQSDVAFDDVSIHYGSCSGELCNYYRDACYCISKHWMSDEETFTLYDQCHSSASSGRFLNRCCWWTFSSSPSWRRIIYPTPRYITSIDSFSYGNKLILTFTNVSHVPCSVCNFDCTFEEDLCSFTQLMTDSFDWTRHSGSTPTAMTGPSADHTKGGRCS